MKPVYEQISLQAQQSIYVREFSGDKLDVPFHHHPEFELVWVMAGEGLIDVRNAKTSFTQGDLILVSGEIPHVFYSNQKYHLLVVHIHSSVSSRGLAELPEFDGIRSLYTLAKKGLKTQITPHSDMAKKLLGIKQKEGLALLTCCYNLLDEISRNAGFECINNAADRNVDNIKMPDRIRLVLEYLQKNFTDTISLEIAANIANMNKSAFCRYFKKHTRRTYTDYIHELRISMAKKELQETTRAISDIAFSMGYNHLTYFNRMFKRQVKMTAVEYRRKFDIKKT